MGIILLAKCDCGFEEEITVDRGNFVTGKTCYAPALCENCNKLLTRNYAEDEINCPYCGVALIKPEEISLRSKHDGSVGTLEKKPPELRKQGMTMSKRPWILQKWDLLIGFSLLMVTAVSIHVGITGMGWEMFISAVFIIGALFLIKKVVRR